MSGGKKITVSPWAVFPFLLAGILTVVLSIIVVLPIILVVFIVALPLVWAASALGFWRLSRGGYRARFQENGLVVHQRKGDHRRFIPWSRVRSARIVFEPPLRYPELLLDSGEELPLHLVTEDELVPHMSRRGLPFDRSD